MKHNVIIVAAKTEYPPVGALYVADALELNEYSVHLLDSNMQLCDFVPYVMEVDPLFVGFSVHTYPNLTEIVEMSKAVHELGYPVVWGGNHPTCLPDECLAEDYIDHVVCGDAESAVVELARALTDGEASACYNCGYTVNLDCHTPAWQFVNLENFVFPASHSVRGGGNDTRRIFYYLMTSRGCPFSCAFCYNSRRPKAPWRAHSADWVKAQVRFLKAKLNIDGIGFWDDFFLGDRRRAFEILESLRNQNVKFLCEARASDLSEPVVAWLKDVGCLQLFIGAESGSDRVLQMIGKGITVTDIRETARLTYKYKLPARFSFIYGFPGETYQEALETKALIKDLKAFPNVSISGPKLYTPYPGTAMYETALAHGFQPPATMEGWASINRASDIEHLPWLARELAQNGKSLKDLFCD